MINIIKETSLFVKESIEYVHPTGLRWLQFFLYLPIACCMYLYMSYKQRREI
jgi:hypothetical protein